MTKRVFQFTSHKVSRGVFIMMLLSSVLFCVYVLGVFESQARNITTYRDTISDSAPEAFSNHRIEFQTDAAIPAGGYVNVRLGDGGFTIPPATFDTDQVELYVSHNSGGYTLRPSTTTPDGTHDGVSIDYGPSGINITLNSSQGIAAGDQVRIVLGTQTANSTTTDTGIKNPTATGTESVYIETGDGGSSVGYASAKIAIVDRVGVGPADTTEEIPPERRNGAPTGELSGLVTAAEITVETDEFARCRYSSTSGVDFYSMDNEFHFTGSIFHSTVITGLVPDTAYTFYVRCIDDENNYNIDDYEISFTVKPLPTGDPGSGEETEGGTGEGTGSGTEGSGSGSSGGSNSSTQTGTGGNRGGGGGGGGVTTPDKPYESGDATVVISGYAFPGSKIYALVDGAIAEQGTASGNGSFSVTVDAIARGVYSFGVYAIDKNDTKSSTFSTTFTVAGGRTSTLSNIHLMPTVVASPNPVNPGEVVTFSGYAIPNSTVSIETQADKSGSPKSLSATSDSSGRWSVTQSTQGFGQGKWKVRAKSESAATGISTGFSQYTFYSIGGSATAPTGNNSDLNRDGKVNLIDFSILLFHWNTDGGSSNPPADINGDGKVSLTDFSIMIFNWTG